MVDETRGVVRHEEKVGLFRVICPAGTRQKPVVQSHLHAPLVVFAEGATTSQSPQCWDRVGIVNENPKAGLGRPRLRSAPGPRQRLQGVAPGAPGAPNLAPILVMEPKGVLEAPPPLRAASATARGGAQQGAPEAVKPIGRDRPNLAVASGFVQQVWMKRSTVLVHHPKGICGSFHATDLEQQHVREVVLHGNQAQQAHLGLFIHLRDILQAPLHHLLVGQLHTHIFFGL
mmetsp:Transcript_55428/g.121293  ORF Transcript_55428/g.121293 Transcript_55428/m.121293 type:complete len:230 (-) Transcript_55428:235-924(-)